MTIILWYCLTVTRFVFGLGKLYLDMPYYGFSFRENLSWQPLKDGLIMEECKGQVIKKEVKRRGDILILLYWYRLIEKLIFNVMLLISKPFEIPLNNMIKKRRNKKNTIYEFNMCKTLVVWEGGGVTSISSLL